MALSIKKFQMLLWAAFLLFQILKLKHLFVGSLDSNTGFSFEPVVHTVVWVLFINSM